MISMVWIVSTWITRICGLERNTCFQTLANSRNTFFTERVKKYQTNLVHSMVLNMVLPCLATLSTTLLIVPLLSVILNSLWHKSPRLSQPARPSKMPYQLAAFIIRLVFKSCEQELGFWPPLWSQPMKLCLPWRMQKTSSSSFNAFLTIRNNTNSCCFLLITPIAASSAIMAAV